MQSQTVCKSEDNEEENEEENNDDKGGEVKLDSESDQMESQILLGALEAAPKNPSKEFH